MSFNRLKNLLSHHKDDIFQEMTNRLSQLPRSPYQEFMLQTKEGRRRLKTWINLVINSLGVDHAPFFKDQEWTGYIRATQGFHLAFSSDIIRSFQQSVWDLLGEAIKIKNLRISNLLEDICELQEILFQAQSIIATSFIRTREEKITEKVTQLQALYDFTHGLITTIKLEEIVTLMLKRITTLFGIEGGLLFLYRDKRIQNVYSYPKGGEFDNILPFVERILKEGDPFFIDEEGVGDRDISRSQYKRVILAPIHAHERCYGVLTLYNNLKSFKFTDKELELLYQFIYIMGVALENTFMLEEIELRHQELHLLTSKLITIEEEERKRLAGDIHDTLAQTLIGISYKIQFCKELVKKNPEILVEHLDNLLRTVNQTIDQARALISSLRPDLIDTMGLIPALKRHIEKFMEETDIRVVARLPKRVRLSSKMSICLFRVVQEALMNVYKHAEAKIAEVTLRHDDGNILMVIADNGKGFDASHGSFGGKEQNSLGLLSMKERLEAVGGKLDIHAGVNKGCRIEARIPLKAGAQLKYA